MKVKARFYESVIYWRARPFEYLLARITRFKKVVYLPFIKTYFINDPLVAKQVLKDIENFFFSSHGQPWGACLISYGFRFQSSLQYEWRRA